MSERILELYTQAIEYANSVIPPERRYNDIYYAVASCKHARLIVRECAQLGTNFTNRNYTDDAGERIAKHFGVEE